MSESGFITYDAVNANDSANDSDTDGLFLKLEVPGYDGKDRTSYLYLGQWRSESGGVSPIADNKLAELCDTDRDGYADYVQNGSAGYYPQNGGSGDAAAYHTDGQPNLDQNGTTSLGVTPQADGDDLLWAFVYNRFYDDSRDRDDNDYGNATAGYTAYAGISEPPDDSLGDAAAPFNSDLRKTITNDIPTYVGWRDHTEGHRITTTRGDKIEVIGGSYKLIVLGRGMGTVRTDWSGGHVVDTMEAPGNVTSINYRRVPVSVQNDASSTDCDWQWVEEVIKGNIIERFYGTKKEELYGDQLITIIGHQNAADGNEQNAAAIDVYTEEPGNWDDATDNAEESNLWDSLQGTTFKLKRPAIVEKVRAKSIYEAEYVDTSTLEIAGAKTAIFEYLGCEPSSWSAGMPKVESKTSNVKASSFKPDYYHEYVHAGNIEVKTKGSRIDEYMRTDTYVSHHEGKDKRINTDVREYWKGTHSETFVGMHNQFFAAFFNTIGVAQRFELVVPWDREFNIGLLVNGVIGFNTSTDFGTKDSFGPTANTKLLSNRLEVFLAKQVGALMDTRARVFSRQVACLDEWGGP